METIELVGWDIAQNIINKWMSSPDNDHDTMIMNDDDYWVLKIASRDIGKNNHWELVYHRYKQVLEENLRFKVLTALQEKHDDELMLQNFVKRWRYYCTINLSNLPNIFDFVEIARLREGSTLPSLSEVGLLCFQQIVYSEIKASVKDATIALINKEREGEDIDTDLIVDVLVVFISMDDGGMKYYEEDFEVPMLLDTAAYYSRIGASWIQENSCLDSYMMKVDRAENYLHLITESKLLNKVHQVLLSQYQQHLLDLNKEAGLLVLTGDDKVDEFSDHLYRLCSRTSTSTELENFSTILKQHVIQEGILLFKRAENAVNGAKNDFVIHLPIQDRYLDLALVGKVIKLLEKYRRYVHAMEFFYKHSRSMLQKDWKDAFETLFCNTRIGYISTSIEELAKFCDDLIKKFGSGDRNDVKSFNDKVDKFFKLLKYVCCDMDLFEEFHRKNLARRLLFDECMNNIDMDHECILITKMKQECGRDLTFKMEGMVADMALARESQTLFKEYLNAYDNAHSALGVDLTVTVLTRVFWPCFESSDLVLPSEMVECVETFNAFYQTKTEKRKLVWICSLGTCHIIGKFEQQPIELVVSTFQAAVLLLFNGAERLSYRDIKKQLNLGGEDIVRLLHSLSCGKYKILIKDPNTNNVSQEDIFEFNYRFTDKMRKILLLPSVQNVEFEKRKTIENVETDRRYAIDACIVRIMKSRRVLPFKQVVSECVEQLQRIFKPDSKFIRSRIEQLIEQEYLDRDKENPNVFRYLA